MGTEKRKDKDDEAGGGTPGWMVTFSDLSTLLLTFFVLLLSMSTMDDMTLKSIFHNFTSSSGILYFKEFGEIYRTKEALIQSLYEKLKDALVMRKANDPNEEFISAEDQRILKEVGSALQVRELDHGFKLVFGQELLFKPGSAEINEDMKPVLARVAKFIKSATYQVYIDGHTDNIPIHTAQFPSNQELSLARAYNLMEYLVKVEKASPVYIALGGYGASHPVASNDTPEGRAKNRRVEIIFKNQRYF
ncbi:MAG: OmpA family protein [Deltaproteobacteria bacterium]|nr:OmpA family protein [Deltaproteobacteria bacterium]MBW2303980.1 OmpA family protein [Deltaproteobacteria bacterium]